MSFNINKSSWHFKFLTWYTIITKQIKPEPIREWKATRMEDGTFIGGEYVTTGYKSPQEIVWDDNFLPSNFCQYWRKTIINPLIRVVSNLASYALCIGLIVAAAQLGIGGGALYFGIGIAIVGAVIAFVFGIMYVGGSGLPRIGKAFKAVFITPDDDSLIGMAYKTHKEKICVNVTYKD